MSIQSNASPDEKMSDFYINNEQNCKKWEVFVNSYHGELRGNYNAWSYHLKSKVYGKKEWLITIERAVYSGAHILLTSRHQNLKEVVTFQTRVPKNTAELNISNGRAVIGNKQHFVLQKLHAVVPYLFRLDNYSVTIKKDILNIRIQYENECFELAGHLMEIEL